MSFNTPQEEHSKFRVGGEGKYLISSLFYETSINKDVALYTLRDMDIVRDGKTYISVRQLYLAMEDITEYEFANRYFGGWNHWKQLSTSPKIGPHVEEWREELELKLRARGMKALIKIAEDGKADAAKYLIEKGWDKKRGRPSAQEKAKEARKEKELSSRVMGDMSRIAHLHKV
jgi:hypothetical protein